MFCKLKKIVVFIRVLSDYYIAFQIHFKAPVVKKGIINQPDDSIAFLQLFAKSDQGVVEVRIIIFNDRL